MTTGEVGGMRFWVQDRADIGYLDDILLEGVYRGTHPHRLPKPVSVNVLKYIPIAHIRQWCIERGNYQVITEELLNWLAEKVKGKKAIEICAGMGPSAGIWAFRRRIPICKHIEGDNAGSMEGGDEVAILQTGATYIHMGNDVTHGYKLLMKLPHEAHYFPWLVTRVVDQEKNHLRVWEGEKWNLEKQLS